MYCRMEIMTARRRTGHLRKATNACIRETAMKTTQFSGRLAGLPFVRLTESFMLSFRWKSSLILALVTAISMGCAIEDDGSLQQEDAYIEPYREAVYDLLAEEDPTRPAATFRSCGFMRSLSRVVDVRAMWTPIQGRPSRAQFPMSGN